LLLLVVTLCVFCAEASEPSRCFLGTVPVLFALRVADRIVLMEKGSIVEEGKPSQVFVNPASDIGQKYKELIEYQMNTSAQSLSGKS